VPFDNAPELPAETRVIDEMIGILGPNGENWIKGDGSLSNKFCLLHAMNIASSNLGCRSYETELRIVEAICKLHRRYMYIPCFRARPLDTR
jgi:hypothetical protein